MDAPAILSAAVEGIVDEAVVRRLIVDAGGRPGTVYGRNGKQALRQKIDGYNNAALRAPWIVVVDLDHECDCAPRLREAWLPRPAPHLCFRVAVRAIEAWLMADAETLAPFLGVGRSHVPRDPEAAADPKRELIDLARRSRRRAIREDMVPREGSGRRVGPAYSSTLIEYVGTRWRPKTAARHAKSLRRAIACLERLIGAGA
ncbi:MAG: hypothetical protein CME06_14880 [Gemmatimonadetes bacterium]|nr:hypothetical protein [Gemmatimonadota bacterium]